MVFPSPKTYEEVRKFPEVILEEEGILAVCTQVKNG
jgi:hypothetical protein